MGFDVVAAGVWGLGSPSRPGGLGGDARSCGHMGLPLGSCLVADQNTCSQPIYNQFRLIIKEQLVQLSKIQGAPWPQEAPRFNTVAGY